MSLIQYHGKIPHNHHSLTEDGLVKGVNEQFGPILHLPYDYEGVVDRSVKYYDTYAMERFYRCGWRGLLPKDMSGAHWDEIKKDMSADGIRLTQYKVKALICNYASLSFLVDSKQRIVPNDGVAETFKRWDLTDPLWNSILNQFFRIVDYLNFKYLITHVEARVIVKGEKLFVYPSYISPLTEIHEMMWDDSGALFKRLDEIVLAAEGYAPMEPTENWRETQ